MEVNLSRPQAYLPGHEFIVCPDGVFVSLLSVGHKGNLLTVGILLSYESIAQPYISVLTHTLWDPVNLATDAVLRVSNSVWGWG